MDGDRPFGTQTPPEEVPECYQDSIVIPYAGTILPVIGVVVTPCKLLSEVLNRRWRPLDRTIPNDS